MALVERYGEGVIRAVVFDVGETLVDETREYGTWADWLGVPRHTFVSVLGAVIAEGRDYRETFQVFKPGFDLEHERRKRIEVGAGESFGEPDLYPDVRSALSGLRAMGVLVGVAGNQTARAGKILRSLDLPADFIATSDDWGVQKPASGFFDRVVETAGVAADEIVYVGDRIDNDLAPAKRSGLRTAFVKRGPWGWIHGEKPEVVELSDWQIDGLDELVGVIASEK
ncbi:HAD family hydrolase [Nocardia sp. NPDC019395]|uniref:HAD family hydrolase n=1 Tax=Nocardia sp. NPDC019395 TaxID=3154686 RepID=UPI0033DD8DD9